MLIFIAVHVIASNESPWYAVGAESGGGDTHVDSVQLISNASFHDDVSASPNAVKLVAMLSHVRRRSLELLI